MTDNEVPSTAPKSISAPYDRRASARVIALAVNGTTVPATLTPTEVREVCRAFLYALGLGWVG